MARGLGLEEEPWRRKEFFVMSRRQQNGQIYDVRIVLRAVPGFPLLAQYYSYHAHT